MTKDQSQNPATSPETALPATNAPSPYPAQGFDANGSPAASQSPENWSHREGRTEADLAEEVERIVWAFDRGDSRRDAVRSLAARIRAQLAAANERADGWEETTKLQADRSDEMQRRAGEAEAKLRCVEAAVVGTIGGVVEGQPTSTVNYLQRLRELVRAESERDALRERAERAERESNEADARYFKALEETQTVTADRDRLAAELEQVKRERDEEKARANHSMDAAVKARDDLDAARAEAERWQQNYDAEVKAHADTRRRLSEAEAKLTATLDSGSKWHDLWEAEKTGREQAEATVARLTEDARRWQALIGCQRIRVVGGAGDYLLCVEFWTESPTDEGKANAVAALREFTDAALQRPDSSPIPVIPLTDEEIQQAQDEGTRLAQAFDQRLRQRPDSEKPCEQGIHVHPCSALERGACRNGFKVERGCQPIHNAHGDGTGSWAAATPPCCDEDTPRPDSDREPTCPDCRAPRYPAHQCAGGRE